MDAEMIRNDTTLCPVPPPLGPTSMPRPLGRGFLLSTIGTDAEVVLANILDQEKEDERVAQLTSFKKTTEWWSVIF